VADPEYSFTPACPTFSHPVFERVGHLVAVLFEGLEKRADIVIRGAKPSYAIDKGEGHARALRHRNMQLCYRPTRAIGLRF
jgi:hypothetical protein